MKQKLESKKELAKTIVDEQRQIEKDRTQYIMKRVKERDTMINEMKEAMKMDVEQQKEIMALKK